VNVENITVPDETLAARVAALENMLAVFLALSAETGSLTPRQIALMRRSLADRKRHGVVPGLTEAADLLPDLTMSEASLQPVP
jgi:hypothetical protein